MLVRRTWKRDGTCNYMQMEIAVDNLIANMNPPFARREYGLEEPFSKTSVRKLLVKGNILCTPLAVFDTKFLDEPVGGVVSVVENNPKQNPFYSGRTIC